MRYVFLNPKHMLRKTMLVYSLKQKLSSCLSQEIDPIICPLDVFFYWSRSEKLGTLLLNTKRGVRTGFNLYRIEKYLEQYSVNDVVNLAVYLTAEYLNTIKESFLSKPVSYLEGLAYLDAISLSSNQKIDFFFPYFMKNRPEHKQFRYSAIDTFCANKVISRMMSEYDSNHGGQADCIITHIREEITSLAEFPEVAYQNSNNPMFSVVYSLRCVQQILCKQPSHIKNAPVLSELIREDGSFISVKEMVEQCKEKGDPLFAGAILRLFAVSEDASLTVLDEKTADYLISIFSDYNRRCMRLFQPDKSSTSKLYSDNLVAAMTIARNLNQFLIDCEEPVSGNVHPM